MKTFNKKITTLIILLILSSITASIAHFQGSTSFGKKANLDELKSSAGEIAIITPENKTYTEAMSGYYSATYGFENDEVGSIPEEWEDFNPKIDPQDHNFIIDSFQGHKRIIEGYDDGNGAWHLRKYFSNQEGTVEFWWAISSIGSSKEHQIAFMNNNTSEIGFAVGVDQGQVRVYIPGGWSNIIGLTTLANTWDHVKIEFRSNNSESYLGLNPNEFRLYYNTVEIDVYPFYTNTSLDYFRLYSGFASNNVYGYYDAFGFSWNPNYSIGDNLHEGVLLSYENSTTIDWQGYSLNGQANRTILGNTTIPMPSDGLHSIQVFGNDSMGTMYESNLRYFTVSTSAPDLTINTPVDSEVFGAISPSYSLSITGLYDTIWYTLDGGASNITASGLTGTIDQTEWDSLGDGIVTIVFYTNNSAGMIGSDVVQVIKSVSVEPPPGIPGYNLVIVLGILCVVTFFIINRRKTKN